MLKEQTSGSAGTDSDSGWTLLQSSSCQSDALPGAAAGQAERSGEAALAAVQMQRLTEKQDDGGSAE